MFGSLGEKERVRFRKKKRKTKQQKIKKKSHRNQKWVGMDKRVF